MRTILVAVLVLAIAAAAAPSSAVAAATVDEWQLYCSSGGAYYGPLPVYVDPVHRTIYIQGQSGITIFCP